MDHNRRPRNFRILENSDRSAEGFNPLCGDQVTIYLDIDDGVITDIGFQGVGCAISKASASMLTDSLKGMTVTEAEQVFNKFRDMLTRQPGEDFDEELPGDLEVFSGVSQYPARIKCAVLSWHTLESALQTKAEMVTTE